MIYSAIWNGYYITFCTEHQNVSLEVDQGCRGWYPVQVETSEYDGKFTILEREYLGIINVNYE